MKKLLIILLVLLILISGCGLVEKECPENVIPDRLDLHCTKIGSYPSTCNLPTGKLQKWLDGTTIYTYRGRGAWCKSGSNEGENVNYIYCDNFIYHKTPISEGGVIQEKIEYSMKLVLDMEDKIEGGYNIVSAKCY